MCGEKSAHDHSEIIIVIQITLAVLGIVDKLTIRRFFDFAAYGCLALMIILTPFRWRLGLWQRPFYPVYSDYTDFLLFAADIPLLFMLVFWGCSLLIHPRKIKWGHFLVWICLAGLTVAGWVSVFGSEDAILSRYHAVRFLLLFFLYLYVVNEVTSPWGVLIPVAIQVLIQIPVGLGQSLAQSSLGLQLFGEHVLDPLQLGTSIIPVNGVRVLRAYGLTDHPNILGGCLAFAMVLLLAAVLYGKKRTPVLASVIFGAAFPVMLLTYSRSAWVSLFVAASFLVGVEALAQRWDSVLRAILLGALSLSLSAPFLLDNAAVFEKRFNSGQVEGDGPMDERAYLLQTGNMLFAEHSAIGVGLGASPLAMKKRFENFPINYQPPHFVPLTAALETGVVGGIFYMFLYLSPMAAFLLRWRTYFQNPTAMGVFALLFAVAIVNLFDYYTWLYAPGRLWQWLSWGLFSIVLEKTG